MRVTLVTIQWCMVKLRSACLALQDVNFLGVI